MHSPIISLRDSFTLTANKLEFQSLGDSASGHHIVLPYKKLSNTTLTADHQNPKQLGSYCTMYRLLNSRGTVYGLLMLVDSDKTDIRGNYMLVKGTSACGKFTQSPVSDKNMLVFDSDSGNVLMISTQTPFSDIVVKDER